MAAENLESICQNARQAIEQRDWDRAKREYLSALGYKSDMPDVHYGLATVYFQLGELTSAAHHFKEVTRLDARRAGAFINLGAVHNLLGEYDDAINVLRKGIGLDPKRTEGYYNLGLVHRRKGQNDLAIQAYREALRLNPRLGDAHLNLANIYVEKGQHRQAVTHYEHALQMRPGWSKALEGLEHAKSAMSGVLEVITSEENHAEEQERHIDPMVHAEFLTTLHRTAVESEETGRHLLAVLGSEVETGIKELSLSLLGSGGVTSDLDSRIGKFEKALQMLMDCQAGLQHSLQRLQESEEQIEHLPAGAMPEPAS